MRDRRPPEGTAWQFLKFQSMRPYTGMLQGVILLR
jgi:hypothetical protein